MDYSLLFIKVEKLKQSMNQAFKRMPALIFKKDEKGESVLAIQDFYDNKATQSKESLENDNSFQEDDDEELKNDQD